MTRALIVVACLVVIFAGMGGDAPAVIDEFGSSVIEEPAAPMATTAISDVFLREGLVPFLALSFVLLAAAIGAIVLARKD